MTTQRILTEEIRWWRAEKFAWGSRDCLCFASSCAEAITGKDPIADLRGTYDSEISAKRVMVERGWKSLGDLAASKFEEIPLARARWGDWVVVVNPDRSETIAVVAGQVCVAQSMTGPGQVSIKRATRAFRVE